jgi:hypothetical protein
MIDYTEMDYTEMELQRIEIRLAQRYEDEDANWLVNLYRNAEGRDRVIFGAQIEEELFEIDRLEERRMEERQPDSNGNRHYVFRVAGIDYVIWNETQVLYNGVQVGQFVNGIIQFEAVG